VKAKKGGRKSIMLWEGGKEREGQKNFPLEIGNPDVPETFHLESLESQNQSGSFHGINERPKHVLREDSISSSSNSFQPLR